MKLSRKLVILFAIMAVASCATNKELVRDNTKMLLKKYRGEPNQKIAIIPFMTKTQMKNPELEAFDDEVMDIVFEDKRFQIVERSLVEQITKEWTFSESGMVDEEQRSKIGKLSGAKLILVPIVSGEKNINMRIISVGTGDVLSYVRGNLAKPIVAGFSEVSRPIPSKKSPGITPTPTPISSGGGSIALGTAVTGAISQPGGRDSYTLNLPGPKTVEIRADKTDASFDPYLELYNNSGAMIASDDDGGDGLNSKIITGLAPGIYTIVVRAYNANIFGSYRLSVFEAMSQPGPYMGGGGNLSTFAELLIQLETSVNYSAQTANWRSRRSSWLNDVRSAGSSNDFHRMRNLVLEFESNILSSAQNANWMSTSRGSWVNRVRNANSLGELSTLLIECESNILYSSQSGTWRNSRSGWISRLQSLR